MLSLEETHLQNENLFVSKRTIRVHTGASSFRQDINKSFIEIYLHSAVISLGLIVKYCNGVSKRSFENRS